MLQQELLVFKTLESSSQNQNSLMGKFLICMISVTDLVTILILKLGQVFMIYAWKRQHSLSIQQHQS